MSNELERAGKVEALALDEAWIHLIVNDLNDNAPKFLPSALPIIGAVSSNAMLGERVTTVKVIFSLTTKIVLIRIHLN